MATIDESEFRKAYIAMADYPARLAKLREMLKEPRSLVDAVAALEIPGEDEDALNQRAAAGAAYAYLAIEFCRNHSEKLYEEMKRFTVEGIPSLAIFAHFATSHGLTAGSHAMSVFAVAQDALDTMNQVQNGGARGLFGGLGEIAAAIAVVPPELADAVKLGLKISYALREHKDGVAMVYTDSDGDYSMCIAPNGRASLDHMLANQRTGEPVEFRQPKEK